MKTTTAIKKTKKNLVRIDADLDQYDNKILFPEKLKKANKALQKKGLPAIGIK